MLPAITRQNIGTLTPDDLMGALDIFDGLFTTEE